MTTTPESATLRVLRTPGEFATHNYLSVDHRARSWLLTTDHKRIGILYLWTIIVFFTIAAVAAALMRIELLTPAGDLVTSQTYNKLFTIHGVLMVWFFLIPSIPAVLGNFVLPMLRFRNLIFSAGIFLLRQARSRCGR